MSVIILILLYGVFKFAPNFAHISYKSQSNSDLEIVSAKAGGVKYSSNEFYMHSDGKVTFNVSFITVGYIQALSKTVLSYL